PAQQEELLRHCYDALLPGGILILRDGVQEDKNKHETTKLTEVFSTKIFRFNKTQHDLHFISKNHIIAFFEKQGAQVSYNNYSKSLSNYTFVIRKPVFLNDLKK